MNYLKRFQDRKTVVILIALEEELNVFRREFGYEFITCRERMDCLEHNLEIGASKTRIIVYCMRDMLAINAFAAAKELLAAFSPSWFINIGIAGCLYDDFRLGDVVIAAECDDVLFKGKDTEEGFKYGGKSYPTSHTSKRVAEILQNRVLLGKSILKSENLIRIGPIATVPFVSASKRIRDIIQIHNRNYMAVDMEAFGTAKAVHETESENRPELLVVKGLSDRADQNKTILETVTKGRMRDLAMTNATRFVLELLREEDMIPSGSDTYATTLSRLHDTAINKYLNQDCRQAFAVKDEGVITRLIDLANNFLPDLKIIEAKTLLQSATRDRFLVGFIGPAGSGVTLVLSILYFLLKQEGKQCIYINIAKVSLPEKTGTESEVWNYLKAIEDLVKNEQHRLIIFLDGIDSQLANRMSILDQIMEKIERTHHTFVFGIRERERDLPLVMGKTISVRPISDKNQYPTLVSAFAESIGVSDITTYNKLIDKFDYGAVDVFLLYLLKNGLKEKVTPEYFSSLIYSFLINYSTNQLGDNRMQRIEKVIRSASKLAFKEFSTLPDEDSNDEETSHEELGSISRNRTMAYELLQCHNTVKNFLIARYIIDVFASWKASEKDKATWQNLPYVYPHPINQFCKDIVKEEKHKQHALVDAIDTIINSPKCDAYMKAHGCYILGRMTDQQAKTRAKGILKALIHDEKYLTTRDKKERMLIRSSFISLGYLGEQSAIRDYLDLLIDRPSWDLFNRGFYLEYYGDREYSPAAPLESADDFKECPNTFKWLIKKLNERFTGEDRLIDLYTLFSLAQHRVERETLDNQIKGDVISIAEKVLDCAEMNDRLRAYAEVVLRQLEARGTRADEVFFDIYSLKFLKRKGWTKRDIFTGESVADHTFGAMAIAKHYLPDSPLAHYPGYDKHKVINMLQRHDWAEGDIGDYTPSDDQLKKQKGERGFWRTLDVLGGDNEYASYIQDADLWREFEENASLNAKIAHDIDRLDNYLQLNIYTKMGYAISDFEQWKQGLIEDLTELGQLVLRRIKSDEAMITQYLLPKLDQLQPEVTKSLRNDIERKKK